MFTQPFGRRAPATLACGVALALALAACGGSSSSSSGKTSTSPSGGAATSSGDASGTIRLVAHAAIQAPMTAVIKQFEKAYPAIHVNAQFVPPGATYVQALTTQIQGGNAPDVFFTNGGPSANGAVSLLPLAKAGKLVNLADRPWSGEVPERARNLYWVGNRLYGLPLNEAPLGVVYNASEFKKLGLTPPTTWTQMLQQCAKIKAAGKFAVALPGQAGVPLPLAAAASTVYAGAQNWNQQRAAGQVTFAGSRGWQQALERVVQMNKAGCFQPGAAGTSVPTAFEMVGSGKALMFIGPVTALGAIAPLAQGSMFAAFPLPGDAVASTTVMVSYSNALAISAKSSNKAAAIKFIDFVASPTQARLLAKLSGAISLAEAKSADIPSQLSAFSPFYKSNKLVSYAPDEWPTSGPLINGLIPAVSGLLTGQQTPASGAKLLDQQWGK